MSSTTNDRILTRDCQSTVIPAGDIINLPAGTKVAITHRLGGNFTVVCEYGMFRILGKDADALGEEIPIASAAPVSTEATDGPPDEGTLWAMLRTVFDPEIPVNIVDLGLVYSLTSTEIEPSKYGVQVAMTLTAPGCGMGPSIAADAESRLITVPGVASAHVEIVWDPPWNQDMISEEGKMQLGLI
ncbi:MAG: putative Fe-S cluster assembly protein SufT [Verrucomicrobia bacterium 21-51-4]|nr:MAG: putative Fe-S cluster assembly protein SufT [Verrucomicrobia bacterium 21-51-4]